jgi:PAS domain S-box-containing protein
MPNGLVKYVQERGQTTYAEDGGPLRSIGTVQDITQVRLAEEALRQNEELFRNVFEHASIGICYNALAGHFLRVNDKFAEITGYPADELIGMDFQAITHPDDLDRDRSDLRALLAGTIPSYSREGRYIRKDGSDAWANLTVALSRDHAGNPGFFVCTMEEITARKRAEQQTLAALQEKETLLKEVHHRVKNNLAVVVELLNMQANRELDPASRSALLESETRIHAMALVHEMIYRSETLAEIDLREHVERLCHQLMETYGRTGAQVHLRMEIDGAGLVLDQAVPFSLLLNELISNALKHAFPEGRSGDIHVRVSTAADGYTTLEVQDDGVGLAPSFNPQKSSSLGLRLVYSLARQLGASVEVIRGSGTAFKFVFKAKHAKVEAA